MSRRNSTLIEIYDRRNGITYWITPKQSWRYQVEAIGLTLYLVYTLGIMAVAWYQVVG